MDWTYGYVQEVDYTHGYYRELAPSILDLACLSRGVSTLIDGRPIRYLELAFGQGLSVNIHATACPGEFWGNDFNPAHAANARALAAAAGSGARLFDDSFEELARRNDLPEFDVIGMHGTWSWISPENRRVVIDIVRRKLAPGGVLYISYNCWPGWASEMPLRHLLKLHSELASPKASGLTAKIDASLEFAQSMLDAGSKYFVAHPGLKKWLENMRGHSRNYLAHEYFNQDWNPMPSADVAQALSEAKVEFAAPAHLGDHFDTLGATEAARKLLAGIKHPVLRETVLDYMTNQRFRRDVFVKGPRKLAPRARDERLRATAFALTTYADQVPMKVKLSFGEAELRPDIYEPFIAALAEDAYSPKTIAWLQQHPRCGKLPLGQIVQAAVLLTGAGHLHPAQPAASVAAAAPRCNALNDHIVARAAKDDDIVILASPVIGSGVHVNRHQQLFLHALQQGLKSEEQWAQHAWNAFSAQGLRLMKEGKAMETVEDNMAHLKSEAALFSARRLPVLKALGIA